MPIGELETHPYLHDGVIMNATRMILGSFPVYECTDPDNEVKQNNRHVEGTVRFFYGSVDSHFWRLYSNYIDHSITLPLKLDAILQSLKGRQIAIADTIQCCQRHNFSSEDSKLVNKTWNREGIIGLIQNGVTKILCTSKGVLHNLEKRIICPVDDPLGKIDLQQSITFQNSYINEINGVIRTIRNPIARVFIIGNWTIKAISIPSPGSPQRQLKQFGKGDQDWQIYATKYFSTAFKWFIE